MDRPTTAEPQQAPPQLHQRLERLEHENRELAEQYLQVERQNNNLLNLYVASTRLHATLEHEGVVRAIKEILIDLVGAEQFCIFVYDAKKQRYDLGAQEGLEAGDPRQAPFQRTDESHLARIARGGVTELARDEAVAVGSGRPIAVVPLVSEDQPMGLLVIYRLLSQKAGFETLDLELFELLGVHASLALVACQLHHRTARKASTLQGMIELLTDGPEDPAGAQE